MQFTLLISLLICHFLADYCLTTPQMIKAKASGKKLQHIFFHSCVHAVLMGLVFFAFSVSWKTVLLLSAFELCSHFVIDYLKGLSGRLFRILLPVGALHQEEAGRDEEELHAQIADGCYIFKRTVETGAILDVVLDR